MVNNADGFFTGLPALQSAKDLKVKQLSCLSKEERLASRLAKIQKANQKIEQLASKFEEVKEGGRRADGRFNLAIENEHLREEYEKKVRDNEELKQFKNQAQDFLQSDNYRVYLEFDNARGTEQWNAYV